MRAQFIQTLIALAVFWNAASLRGADQVSALTSELKSSDGVARIQAIQNLGAYGPLARDAVPELVALLKADDLATRHEAVIALGKIGQDADIAVPALSALLDSDSLILRHSAIHALRLFGPAAKPALAKIRSLADSNDDAIRTAAAWATVAIDPGENANVRAMIPILVRALGHKAEAVRADAIYGLALVGPPAVKEILTQFDGGSAVARRNACDALAAIGPDAEDAVPALVKELDDEDDDVVWHAARALGAIASHADLAVPTLTKRLKHSSPAVRHYAAASLGSFYESAAPAVPVLIAALKDSSVKVRVAAANSLGNIGPAARSAVKPLGQAMAGDQGAVTLAAAEALHGIGEAAVPELAGLLKDEHLNLLSAHVLGEMGEAAADAVPELIDLLKSDVDTDTRVEALIALANIGPKARAAIPFLTILSQSGPEERRGGAIYALAKIDSSKVVPIAKEAVKSDEVRLSRAAAWALLQSDPTNEEYQKLALPKLVAALDAEIPLVRREALNGLALIGPNAKSAASAIVPLAGDPDPEVRASALAALAEIGASSNAIVVAVSRGANDEIATVRYTAGYAMGRLGSREFLPYLNRMLESRDEFQRTVAAWARAKIDHTPESAKIAIPYMIRALGNPSEDVRIEAITLLGEIGAGSQDVKDALMKAKGDSNDRVGEAAAAALKKLSN